VDDPAIGVSDVPKLVAAWYVLRTRSRHEKTVNTVGCGGPPEPVPDAEIAAIQHLAATTLQYDPHPFLTEGMDVEVVRGPLAGIRGKLLRKDRVTRLVLAVTLIRQAAVVEIHPADVVAVGRT